ncbi:MAG: hypothetical protein AB7F74_15215 [Parvibaculaceae bacterium]
MKFQLVMAVWGDSYIDTMLRATIPMLLSSGNIPALSNLSSSDITFYTRPEDERNIRDAAVVRHLQKFLAVRIAYIDPTTEKSKYNAMATAQWMAALRAQVEGAHCLMLGPDFVIADGSLATLSRLAAAGKSAVMSYGPRLKQQAMLNILDDMRGNGSSITISSRQLVRLTLEHLHPESASSFVSSDCFPHRPSFCLWPAKDGFLLRGFNLHPIMIDLSESSPIKHLDIMRTDASDGHFIGHATGRWSSIHVETDSDNFFMGSLHPTKNTHSPIASRLPVQDTVRGMAYHTEIDPVNRSFFLQAIRIHAGDLDEDWDKVEEESGRWAFEALTIGRNTRGAHAFSELSFSKWNRKKRKFIRKYSKAIRSLVKRPS